jgi:hypothetical protein
MLCITGSRLRRLPVHQKVLTVQVYGRSLVHGGFWGDRDVEKLRKALEKKAAVFQRKKQNAVDVVNGEPEFSAGPLKNACPQFSRSRPLVRRLAPKWVGHLREA